MSIFDHEDYVEAAVKTDYVTFTFKMLTKI